MNSASFQAMSNLLNEFQLNETKSIDVYKIYLDQKQLKKTIRKSIEKCKKLPLKNLIVEISLASSNFMLSYKNSIASPFDSALGLRLNSKNK